MPTLNSYWGKKEVIKWPIKLCNSTQDKASGEKTQKSILSLRRMDIWNQCLTNKTSRKMGPKCSGATQWLRAKNQTLDEE